MKHAFLRAALGIIAMLAVVPAQAQSQVKDSTTIGGNPGAVQVTNSTGAKAKVPAYVPVDVDGNVISGSGGPSSDAAAGIAPVTTTTDAASSLVACSAACNLYGYVGKATTAGYFLVTNTTSAPSDGTLSAGSLLNCVAYPGSGTVSVAAGTPIRASTGATIIFSTTGCWTKTASASATISVQAK